jgi:hypothetical protein
LSYRIEEHFVTPSPAAGDRDVVIAVDPHNASWTAVAVAADLTAAATLRVKADRAGYRGLRRFAARWPRVRWAVEGAAGLDGSLTERLRADECRGCCCSGEAGSSITTAVHGTRSQERPG